MNAAAAVTNVVTGHQSRQLRGWDDARGCDGARSDIIDALDCADCCEYAGLQTWSG